jgi:hypothetical protein
LYELSDQLRELVALIDAGEFTEADIADQMDEIRLSFAEKVESCAGLLKSWKHQQLACQVESARLADKAKAIGNRIDSMEDYVIMQMEKLDMTQCNAGVFTVKLRKKPDWVRVDDEKAIPEYYLRRSEPVSVNKSMLKEDLKNGAQVLGATLVKGAPGLQVK